jgi:hypothetical protein
LSTWNAIYFRGNLPDDFRPAVEGPCTVRRVSEWLELALPGVDDGEATALALSSRLSGQVIWVVLQTAASVVEVMHCENGAILRRIEFADGSWRRVDGTPQPWEAWLFSEEELVEAREVGDPENDAELEQAFFRKTLKAGDTLPWPREWPAFFQAVGFTQGEWEAAQALPPVATLEGSKTSKLTLFARAGLVLGAASLVGLALSRDGGFAGLAIACLLFAFGAGYVRKVTLGRWFL